MLHDRSTPLPHVPPKKACEALPKNRTPSEQGTPASEQGTSPNVCDAAEAGSASRLPGAALPGVALPAGEHALPGAILAQYTRCGKAGCRCRQGELHGPYYYRFWRERGRLKKAYVKKADAAQALAQYQHIQRKREATREHVRRGRAIVEASKNDWRSMSLTLRNLNRF